VSEQEQILMQSVHTIEKPRISARSDNADGLGPCSCGMHGKRFVTLDGDSGFLCPHCLLSKVADLRH